MNISFASWRESRVLLAALLMIFSASAAQAADGRFGVVFGSVEVNGAPAKRGSEVSQGDTISAAKGASAVIVMKDKTTIRVSPDSQIRIKEYRFEDDKPSIGKIVVALSRGTMRFVSGLINKRRPGSSSVVTPVATMGIRGSDGVFSYTPASGNFTVQFSRGSGVMRFLNAQGVQVAAVPVPTGQRSTAQIGSRSVQREENVPDAVSEALNAAKGADGEIDEAAMQQQAAGLSEIDRMVLIAVAATQEGEDVAKIVGAVAGSIAGATAGDNAAAAAFVGNLIDPGKTVEITREALENLNAGQGGATADDALAIVEAVSEVSGDDGREVVDTVKDMGLLNDAQVKEVLDTLDDGNQGGEDNGNATDQNDGNQEEDGNEPEVKSTGTEENPSQTDSSESGTGGAANANAAS